MHNYSSNNRFPTLATPYKNNLACFVLQQGAQKQAEHLRKMKIQPPLPDQCAYSSVSTVKFLVSFKQCCSLIRKAYVPDRNTRLTRRDASGHKQFERIRKTGEEGLSFNNLTQ